MYFCVNEFEVGVNDSIFSGDEQQKVNKQLIDLACSVPTSDDIRSLFLH